MAINDAMSMILWTRRFLESQGFPVNDNIIFQDNESTMKLANYGQQSSSKRTRHIDVQYYFVTDNTQQKLVRIVYCPTGDMISDFVTKPLQGSLFRRFLNEILNISPNEEQLPPAECVEASQSNTARNKSSIDRIEPPTTSRGRQSCANPDVEEITYALRRGRVVRGNQNKHAHSVW